MGQTTALRSDTDLFQIDSEGVVFIGRGVVFPCTPWIWSFGDRFLQNNQANP